MSASKAIGYTIGAVLAAVVTIALFILMFTLIVMRDINLDEDAGIKIADIQLGETSIDTQIKQVMAEKPEDPDEPPPEMRAPRQSTNFDVDTAINVSFAPKADVKIDIGGLSVSDGEYLPIVKVAPIYPRRAQSRGIQGYCIVEYTVTKSGSIRDSKAIDCDPPGIFDSASVKASLKFKYKPRVVDGQATEVAGVRNKFTYKLEQ
jgi:protein TonB